MLAKKLDTIVHTAWFQNGILAVIMLAALVVGLETNRELMAEHGELIKFVDGVIILIFVIEALMKMGAHGRRPYHYFRDPWNCFDFTIVVLCLIPATGQFAAVIRLARVLRTLRLVSAVPRLQIIVASLLKGLPSMGYVGLLLLMLFYVYGVMGVFLFRDNDPFHFGELSSALLTLFRIVTLEDWTDILYTQMYGSNIHPTEGTPATGPDPVAQPAVAATYFVSFVLLGTIIMLNLVIGVILSSMQEAQTERDRAALAAARESEHGLTADQEIELLEHQLEDMKRHLHLVRAGLKREQKRPTRPSTATATDAPFASELSDEA